jgi:penicillin-binding protein 2
VRRGDSSSGGVTTRARPPRRTGLRAGLSTGGWAPALTPGTAVRIAILGGIALALLGLLLIRLWFLQVISGDEYSAAAEGNRLRTVVTEAPRGKVLDRNGELLVGNRTGTNLVVSPRELTGARREQVLRTLARKLDGVTFDELMKRVQAGESRPLESVVIAQSVRPVLAYYIAQRERQFPGVGLRDTYLRTYPEGTVAAHVVGSTGKISAAELDDYRARGYGGNETVGKGGVEQEYEGFLRGTPGRYTREVDASGEPTGREVVSSQAPRPGRDVQLTIDSDTQRALQNAIAEQVSLHGLSTGGAGVALDPNTGEVLALASYPDYDPSLFVDGSQKRIADVISDPANRLLDRAIGGSYPAGSIFKPISAAAGLGGGLITADERIESPAEIELYKTIFPNFRKQSHGFVDLPTALQVSSDTYFYRLGDEFYRAAGSPLQEQARSFGLGERTGLDLPGEIDGLIPDPAWKRKNFAGAPFTDLDRSWKPGDTINLSVGQGYLGVTPLQMAVAYAAIASGGTVPTPTVGRRVLDPNGRELQDLSSGKPTSTIDVNPDHLASIREGLHRAANRPGGTSTSVFGLLPADRKVAGKTGTAEQVQGREDHSWFVGYAPYDNPKIVVAVVIEAAGTGSSAAAPTVCRTIAAYSETSFDPALCGDGAEAN